MSRLIRLLTLITYIGSFTSIFGQSVSRESAISMVKTQIVGIDTVEFNIYMKPDIFADDYIVTRVSDSIENPYSFSWLFFVDEMPA